MRTHYLLLFAIIFFALPGAVSAKPGHCLIDETAKFQPETDCENGDTVIIQSVAYPLREIARYCNMSKKIIREPNGIPSVGGIAVALCTFQKKVER
jgi:hypothetical protein